MSDFGEFTNDLYQWEPFAGTGISGCEDWMPMVDMDCLSPSVVNEISNLVFPEVAKPPQELSIAEQTSKDLESYFDLDLARASELPNLSPGTHSLAPQAFVFTAPAAPQASPYPLCLPIQDQVTGQLLTMKQFAKEVTPVASELLSEEQTNNLINTLTTGPVGADDCPAAPRSSPALITVRTWPTHAMPLGGTAIPWKASKQLPSRLLRVEDKPKRPKMQRGEWAQLDYHQRLSIKRERNRVAAKKCRERKLKIVKEFEEKERKLKDDNKNCEFILMQLRRAVAARQLFLLKHHSIETCSQG